MALTEVIGYKIHTIGKVKATIKVGNKKLRHTIYLVKDGFPIGYKELLGIDFLIKQKADCFLRKKQVRIEEVVFKFHPYYQVKLPSRSETIVQAVTDSNRIGIVQTDEARLGIIENCLVSPVDNTCPVSIINTNTKAVTITTLSVVIEEIPDIKHVFSLETAKSRKEEAIQDRDEQLMKQLRSEHLNAEEKCMLQEICCKDFNDIFVLEGDITFLHADGLT